MRHIDRLPIPQILIDKHDEWQAKYNQKLATDSKARPDASKYRHQDIYRQLNSCSFNKCFYCESKLTGDTREIDHYIEVAIDHNKAYDWDNLYLSCINCNDKLDHNVIPVTNALDPCTDSDEDIQSCITFEAECICSQPNSVKGRNTIQKFRLDSDLLDLRRSKWLNKLNKEANIITSRMIDEGRSVPTEDEKSTICKFMQEDQPYSLMCKIYIKKYLGWAL